MDLALRRAKRADFRTIWEATLETVWVDLPPDERARMDRVSWERHFRSKIKPLIEGSRTEAWVAEDPSGVLVGYLLLGPGGGFLTPEEYGFIFDVWVEPSHRGKGIGRFLVSWASEWALKRGYRKIKLEVAEVNEGARRIYEGLGFERERQHMGKRLR